MITFYFNSNLPEYYTGDLCEVFDNLMLKFILLLNDKKLPINGYIATNNQPSTILICGKTLKSLIDNFNIAEKDKYKEHRKKLYSFFTRYPIDLDVRVEEVFSEEELTSSIKFHGRDATDLFIANKMKYYFMSLPLDETLKVDSLGILVNETALKNVNWHGMNTKNLIQHIIEDETIDNANLSILKYSFGDNECFICDSFMDEFKLISPDLQEFIINLFAKALQSGLLFPARGDDNIVKKCDADNVYELRNHAYGGIRVYFRCVDNKIFIGNMGTKSSYKGDAQSNDIAHAGKVMDKLERTMRY